MHMEGPYAKGSVGLTKGEPCICAALDVGGKWRTGCSIFQQLSVGRPIAGSFEVRNRPMKSISSPLELTDILLLSDCRLTLDNLFLNSITCQGQDFLFAQAHLNCHSSPSLHRSIPQ